MRRRLPESDKRRGKKRAAKYADVSPNLPGPKLQARQDSVIEQVAQGSTIEAACAQVGIRVNTHNQWRKRWPRHYGVRIDYARAKNKSFFLVEREFDAKFRDEFYGYSTPPHLQKVMDVINRSETEAREQKRKRRVLILMPPEHAKSTLLEDYVTYRISQNQAVKCLFISKTLNQAKKRTGLIQRRLTERTGYADFIDTYGPFKSEVRADMKPWTRNFFTIFRAPPDQRDYTLEALGIGGDIYGNRTDVMVLDDIADLNNQTPMEIEKQWEWIWQEARTRLVKGGLLICIGTHIREGDIYSVAEEKGFFDEVVKMPAIVREPQTNSVDDPGEALWEDEHPLDELLGLRQEDHRMFELVYQQNPLPSVGAIFPLEAIESCYDKDRYIGHIPEGTYVVAGVDPSVTNYTAGVVFAVKKSGMRYLVDAWNEKGLTGEGGDTQAGVIEFIVELCKRYRVRSLAVENYSWSALINNSLTLRKQLHELGVQHFPARDPGPGSGQREQHALAQLSGLFSYGLINIPAALQSVPHLRAFRDQLVTYRPDAPRRAKNDLVKALRWTEMAARKFLNGHVVNTAPHITIPDWMEQAEAPDYLDESVV